jgi:hypothetical protein
MTAWYLFGGGLKVFQKPFPVPFALENGLALVAAGGDVIKCARKSVIRRGRAMFAPLVSIYRGKIFANIAGTVKNVNCGDLTLLSFKRPFQYLIAYFYM